MKRSGLGSLLHTARCIEGGLIFRYDTISDHFVLQQTGIEAQMGGLQEVWVGNWRIVVTL